ncbi:unnamed protein product [Meloidogyne enterolobii]|uniref:Uncharacterized protein n=1 Tax=Meloidogyne enterolobii TaxID=390850 RepID=A0ACB0Z8H5_MELEN
MLVKLLRLTSLFTAVIKGVGELNGREVKRGTAYLRKALEVGNFVGLKNKHSRSGEDEVLLSKVIKIKENGKYKIQIIQKPLFGKKSNRFPKELTITKVFAVGEEVEVYKEGVWVKAKVIEVPDRNREIYRVEFTEQSGLYGERADIDAINMSKIEDGSHIQH